eukprot:14130400-Alexandrium_andersonii.AAC.1
MQVHAQGGRAPLRARQGIGRSAHSVPRPRTGSGTPRGGGRLDRQQRGGQRASPPRHRLVALSIP